MTHITLAVTEAVLEQAKDGNASQRQIAIQGASTELHARIDAARAKSQVVVAVNGVFELSVGDTSAIWGVHQTAGLQTEDFTSLYDLLARRPGRPVKFAWE